MKYKGKITDNKDLVTKEYVDGHHDSTKQDVISDLSTIRSGATAGSTALQSVPATYRTAAQQDLIHDATKENLGKITINGTEYTVAISTTDAGTAGYITFVVDSTNQNSGPSNGPSSYDSGDMDM